MPVTAHAESHSPSTMPLAEQPSLSVIIPAYNAERTLRACVESVLDSDLDQPLEVIVVDDGSTDRSVASIRDLDVRIISQRNRGAAGARNRGAKEARSDLLVFTDADVIFFRDTLRRMYEHLARPEVDFLGVRYSKRPANTKWIHRYKALADYSYSYDLVFSREQKRGPMRNVFTGPLPGIEGLKRRIFEQIGGFDETIKGADVEREKLHARLFGKCNMVIDGTITVRHHFPEFGKLLRTTYFLRTMHVAELMFTSHYSPPGLTKNMLRVLTGALVDLSFVVAMAFFVAFESTRGFLVTMGLFLCYAIAHARLFVTAYRTYGLLFTLYAVATNLLCCLVISFAGLFAKMRSLRN